MLKIWLDVSVLVVLGIAGYALLTSAQLNAVCLGCGSYPMSCVSSAAEPNPPKNRNVGSNAGQIAVWDCSGMALCFESAQIK